MRIIIESPSVFIFSDQVISNAGRTTMRNLKVLALTRYGALGASSRLRFFQYLPSLNAAGVQVKIQSLFDDSVLSARYKNGHYSLTSIGKSFVKRVATLLDRKQFDLVWIEYEALPWLPQWLESALLRNVPYVLEYDDAVFHKYDSHNLAMLRRTFGRRLDGLMARSALVVAGNDYLAQRAINAGARWVEVLPTVIDLERYPSQSAVKTDHGLPRIVWIGSPSTACYLDILRQPFQRLGRHVPFVLRVIGATLELPGVQMEFVPWSTSTEVAAITACDVGVMPLLDSQWERGKCGYKLIQYMACGLPVVASPVGVNSTIVRQGVSGFLPENDDEWVTTIERLLKQPDLRKQLGYEGRLSVEQRYCLQVTGPKLANWLRCAANWGV